jgi:hypothetical protein
MRYSLENNELQGTCALWQITHDVGLGIFTWMHASSAVLVPGNGAISAGSMYWHKPGHDMDVYFQEIWHQAYLSNKNPDKYDKLEDFRVKESNDKFDMNIYLARERAAGKSLSPLPYMPLTGFQSTLFDRRRRFREVIHAAIGESVKNDK